MVTQNKGDFTRLFGRQADWLVRLHQCSVVVVVVVVVVVTTLF